MPTTPAQKQLTADRMRQVVLLRVRGLSFELIGKQLGIKRQSAHELYKKALKVPKQDIEELRKLEAERIADLRQRLWGRLAGKPDPADPSKTVYPDDEALNSFIRTAISLSRHEALVFGMDAPVKTEILGGLGIGANEAEIDAQLARLTPEERDMLMVLVAKMQGRWIAPPGIEDQGVTVETTATAVDGSGEGEPDGNG